MLQEYSILEQLDGMTFLEVFSDWVFGQCYACLRFMGLQASKRILDETMVTDHSCKEKKQSGGVGFGRRRWGEIEMQG